MLADRQKNKDKYTTTIEPKIYGLQVDDDLVYVGKTHVGDKDGNFRLSKIQVSKMNKKLKKIIKNKKRGVRILEIKDTDFKNWYKDRNKEAHFRFINGEVKLVNDPWILEGKRSYWDGKVKDRHTIDRMSESKHKRVAQYDVNGKLIKIWDSSKTIGIEFLKDYVVIDGGGKTKMYLVLKRKIKNRLFHKSYWFKEEEILKSFSKIPIKLNINAIIEQEKKESKKNRKHTEYSHTKVYKINRYKLNGKLIRSYDTAEEAAKRYKVDVNSIRRACRLGQKLCGYLWEYGERHSVFFDKKTKKYINK